MTNVEYIDYFEKIIANEPENILSLYFVQKLMSDVRFRSFQPMISAELQKKILKMVLPKLKNQFKINRLVDFNPIGVADEEIEILNKESVTDVGTFVKTLDDGKVCKEIENSLTPDMIAKINASIQPQRVFAESIAAEQDRMMRQAQEVGEQIYQNRQRMQEAMERTAHNTDVANDRLEKIIDQQSSHIELLEKTSDRVGVATKSHLYGFIIERLFYIKQ